MNYKFSVSDIEHFAEAKVGIDGWKAYRWERADEDSIITGDIPHGVYKTGKRKGRPKFIGNGRKVVVTNAEMQAHAAAWEAATGKCWDCKGTGQTWAGWSKAEGTRYRTCQRCNGSKEAQR
jgi:hypothetical protein